MKNPIRRARTCDVAFTYRMPAGIPGAVTRIEVATIEAQQLDIVNYPTSYGVPVVIDATSHNIRKVLAGDVSASIYGFYVRPYPTSGGASDGLGTVTCPTNGIGNVLKRGYMTVKVSVGIAVKSGPIYTRIGANGANVTLDDVEAASDTVYTILVPGQSYFMGAADASGNVEIAVNI